MARKTKEDALKTREMIIDAAVRVFAEKGLPQTTLTDIAEEAGVTRGAIYWHFKNKAELVEVLWADLFSPFETIRHVDEATGDLDPLGVLHQAHLQLFAGLVENPRRLRMLNILLASETADDSTHGIHADHFSQGQQIIGEVLTRAIRQGQLPETFNIRLGAFAVMAFMGGLLRKWIMFPDQLRATEEIQELLKGLMNMLRTSFTAKSGG